MPRFRYVAKNGPTEVVEKVLEAENREAVLSQLGAWGYTPLRIIELAENEDGSPQMKSLNGRVPARQMNIFTRQLASLVRSQIPIFRALSVLEEQTQNERLRRVIVAIREDIQREGHNLSDAMRNYPKVFSGDYTSLIYAGEVGGVLEEVMDKLAEKAERENELTAKLQGALVYPAFVGLMGVLTVLVLVTFVLPRILTLLTGFGGELPMPTKILIWITEAIRQGWFWATIAIGVLAFTLLWRTVLSKNRLLLDKLLLRVPTLGTLISQVNLIRFCRSLGLLIDHGVLILQALEVSIPVARNHYIRSQLQKLPQIVKEGGTLTQGLEQTTVADAFVTQTVAIGEEGGRIGEALAEITNYYEREAGRLMQILAGVLEPIMILAIGGFVGFIVIAVMLPIFEMSAIAR